MLRQIIFSTAIIFFVAARSSYAAQTICNDNGGAGWPINDGTNTTIQIEYQFGDVGYLTDVDVDVDINHTWMGDLTASITSPDGSNVVLFSRPGTTQGATVNAGPYGCSGNNLDVLFNDESANIPIENATCGNNPAYSGNHRPHNASPNNLSAFDSENPTGVWDFNFFDPIDFDTGTMNEACLVVSAAAVTFDQWVSTNSSCIPQVDALSVVTGTNLYVCYTLSNAGDESFTLGASPDWNDSLGNNLSSLQGTYAASASQSVNFGPFVAGASPFFLGTTVATSDVTIRGNAPPDFPNTESIFTDETITVSVNNVAPGSASKPLYLYNNLNLSRITPTMAQAEVTMNELVTRVWTLTPNLQSNLVINTVGGSIPVSLYLRETGTGSDRDITFTVSGSVSGLIATFNTTIALTGTSTLYNINLPITGATNLVTGEAITLTVRNNTTGSGTRAVLLRPSNGTNAHSRVSLPSNTIINVDNIVVYDLPYANPAAQAISYAQASETIYIRARISDPFGTFDITSINNQISDPTPTVQATNQPSSVVLDTGLAEKTYEFSYTIPPFPVLGDWRISVTANEGSVAEGITHNNFIDFLILAAPSLTVVKTANIAGNPITSADPGDTVTYRILVTNSGDGYAENIILDDVMSPFADLNTGSFVCTSGCPSSGVAMGTPTFNYDGFGDVVDWNLIMGGTMNGGGASFTIEYQADIEN